MPPPGGGTKAELDPIMWFVLSILDGPIWGKWMDWMGLGISSQGLGFQGKMREKC